MTRTNRETNCTCMPEYNTDTLVRSSQILPVLNLINYGLLLTSSNTLVRLIVYFASKVDLILYHVDVFCLPRGYTHTQL